MKSKEPIKVKLQIDPNAKEMTTDIACRTFLGKSEDAFIKELQIYGIDYLFEQLKNKNKTLST